MSNVLETIKKIGNVKEFSNLTIDEIKEIRNATQLVNNFNQNINKYGEHIFYSEYALTVEELREKLSDKDFKALKLSEKNVGTFVYCYKKKKLYNLNRPSGWIMGAISRGTTNFSFDNQNRLVVTFEWSTQSARFSHIPWVSRKRIITIELQTREVISDVGDSFKDYM